MADLLDPLDKAITEKLLPAITGICPISDEHRKMFALPVRAGGLGIPILKEIADDELNASLRMTAPLAAIMTLQSFDLPSSEAEEAGRKLTIALKQDKETQSVQLVESLLSDTTVRAFKQAQAKGASSWLGALPLKEHGFTLNKSEFWDAISIRYGFALKDLPSTCPCGERYDLDHALNCKRGGFVIMRHNNVRDFEANLLSKVCTDVQKEPSLQPLTGERIAGHSEEGARPDIRARGFWRPAQNAFFDVRLTNINSASQRHMPFKQVLDKHEAEKKRAYNDRVMNVEHGTFTPLVFSLNGVMSTECERYHKNLACKIADKSGEKYSAVMNTMRTKLSFLILRACLTCVRGSRPHTVNQEMATAPDNFGQVAHEASLYG